MVCDGYNELLLIAGSFFEYHYAGKSGHDQLWRGVYGPQILLMVEKVQASNLTG